MDSSDSSEDLPLSLIASAAKRGASKQKEISDSDSDDDVPLASFTKKTNKHQTKRKTVSSSESDDDIPLASLRKKMRASATKKRKKAVPKSKPAPKAKGKTRSGPVKKTVSATAGDSYDTIIRGASSCPKTYLDKMLTKAHVVEGILIRWRYAFDWNYKGSKSPDPGFLMLRGFPGVFLGCKGDHIGEVSDKRDWSCDLLPTSTNLSQRPGSELKELLIKAIEGQIKDLIENEPRQKEKERLQAELKQELVRVKRINAAKLK